MRGKIEAKVVGGLPARSGSRLGRQANAAKPKRLAATAARVAKATLLPKKKIRTTRRRKKLARHPERSARKTKRDTSLQPKQPRSHQLVFQVGGSSKFCFSSSGLPTLRNSVGCIRSRHPMQCQMAHTGHRPQDGLQPLRHHHNHRQLQHPHLQQSQQFQSLPHPNAARVAAAAAWKQNRWQWRTPTSSLMKRSQMQSRTPPLQHPQLTLKVSLRPQLPQHLHLRHFHLQFRPHRRLQLHHRQTPFSTQQCNQRWKPCAGREP